MLSFGKKELKSTKKVYKVVVAQFGQACKECEQADAALKESE